MARRIKINIPELSEQVSGIISIPDDPICIMALAHGAGADMEHAFMGSLSNSLNEVGVATLRFNFLYKEKGKNRPDSPRIAHAAQRAALKRAGEYANKAGVPVVAAGKSFGGRMFSQLLAQDDLGAASLVFYGFPLHAPGKPGTKRADHLKDVKVPMLFLQGTRDALATPEFIRQVSKGLRKATIRMYDGADHSFKMLKRSGISDEEMIDKLAGESVKWIREKLGK